MDMLCNKCSEPWSWFYLRDDVLRDQTLYEKMEKHGGYVQDSNGTSQPCEVENKHPNLHPVLANWQFAPGPYVEQCPACYGKIVDIKQSENAKIRADLAHLYGDDIDGFMADMEDFGLDE